MKNNMAKTGALLIVAFFTLNIFATGQFVSNLEIKMIRVVGDYPGATYDNSIELWFTQPLNIDSAMNCNVTYRVFVDAKNEHLVAAAYMAKAMKNTVRIYMNDALPIRGGACEISYLDILD